MGAAMTGLPPGFVLDGPAPAPAPAGAPGLPAGFVLDAGPAAAPSMTETAVRGALQSLSLGFADEAYAAGKGAKSWWGGQGFGTGYDAGLAEYRSEDKAAATANPITDIAGRVGGAFAGAIPAAGLITAPTLIGRMGQSAAVGAGMGGAQGAGEGETTESRVEGAARGGLIGGALGGAGEAVVSGVGSALGKLFGGAKAPAPGVVPAERIAEAAEFGVPLTRGQATGNVGQQAYEEAARNAARGGPAASKVQAFDAQQSEAFQAARAGVSQALGGEAIPAPAMGEAIQSAVTGRARELRSASQTAYDAAAGKEANIAIGEVGNLAKRVETSLGEGGIVINPQYGNLPGSQAAMNILKRVSGFEGAPEGVVAQSLSGLDQARKAISGVRPANAEDARALREIRKSFDGWLDDAVDQKLFSGDATAIADLKTGRELWSQYKGLTTAKPGDAAPSIIVKMQKQDVTGEQVANWLLGTAGADQAGRSAAVAQRLKGIVGANSPEWEALRQSAYTKMMEPARGSGPQAVSNAMFDFLDGQGAPLAKSLFSKEEMGQMRRLAGVTRMTVPDPKATNPSKSGYEVARLLGSNGAAAAGAGAAALGTAYATGDPKYLAIAALPFLKNAASLSKGVAATKAAPSAVGQAIGRAARVPALIAPGLVPQN